MNHSIVTDRFPLSPMQQGMLFHHVREAHSGVDIEQLVVHLTERMNVSQFEAAWQWLVQRHEILRARFNWEGIEEPQQEILASVTLPFAVEDGGGGDP
jgi:surfactin family lipopeptide synthetase C